LESSKRLLRGTKAGCGFRAFGDCLLDREAGEDGAGLGLISGNFLFGDVHGASSLSFGKIGTKGLRLSAKSLEWLIAEFREGGAGRLGRSVVAITRKPGMY
jgi:hypothetical protein